jgi:hypothetical protein
LKCACRIFEGIHAYTNAVEVANSIGPEMIINIVSQKLFGLNEERVTIWYWEKD